jgi:hypothetical protein
MIIKIGEIFSQVKRMTVGAFFPYICVHDFKEFSLEEVRKEKSCMIQVLLYKHLQIT